MDTEQRGGLGRVVRVAVRAEELCSSALGKVDKTQGRAMNIHPRNSQRPHAAICRRDSLDFPRLAHMSAHRQEEADLIEQPGE